jgi:PTS system N-acetylglucosamine-specific IIC component
VLRDRARVDTAALRALGASGTVNVGASGMQVVVGPTADQLASDIRACLARPAPAGMDREAWMKALGGRENVTGVQACAGRVLVTVRDGSRVEAQALEALGARAVAAPGATSIHVLHADAAALEETLARAG